MYAGAEPVLGELTVISAEGTASGKTIVTVTPTKSAGRSYKYKVAANPTLPAYDAVCGAGYTVWDGAEEITATAGQKIAVVEVDAENKAKAAGLTSVTVKA